jgi:hypothetical protein
MSESPSPCECTALGLVSPIEVGNTEVREEVGKLPGGAVSCLRDWNVEEQMREHGSCLRFNFGTCSREGLVHTDCFNKELCSFFFFFLQYWGLNSEPTP